MALSRQQKEAAIAELSDLLRDSKLSVVSTYSGLNVADLQELRKQARESQTVVKVAKNRLVEQAMKSIDALKDVDTSGMNGQLLYAFNSEDEVAPAQALHALAKTHPDLQFVGAISASGEFFTAEQVQRLAELPTKDQLRGQLVGVLAAPMTGLANVLAGNLRGFVQVLKARSETI